MACFWKVGGYGNGRGVWGFCLDFIISSFCEKGMEDLLIEPIQAFQLSVGGVLQTSLPHS